MEKALAAFSTGRVIQPVRNMLTIEDGKRFLGIMPAAAPEGMGAKLVCFFPKNACESRSDTASQKRLICSVALPEQKCGR